MEIDFDFNTPPPDITAFLTMNSFIKCLSISLGQDDPESYSINFLRSLPLNLPLEELTLKFTPILDNYEDYTYDRQKILTILQQINTIQSTKEIVNPLNLHFIYYATHV